MECSSHAYNSAQALKLKRDIEQAQKEARVDIDASTSDEYRYNKESKTFLEEPVQTGKPVERWRDNTETQHS
jgi:hypothetical protein